MVMFLMLAPFLVVAISLGLCLWSHRKEIRHG